ncbi:MAG: hypothetical protein U9R14_01890, partial [Patescibacteria group bacterium]|nr:hypothetical protein [Patescibacteria group bacterium]
MEPSQVIAFLLFTGLLRSTAPLLARGGASWRIAKKRVKGKGIKGIQGAKWETTWRNENQRRRSSRS